MDAKKYEYGTFVKKYGVENISDIEQPSEPWWFKGILEKKRLIDKETRDLLNPRNISLDGIKDASEKNSAEMLKLEDEKKYISSAEYTDKRAAEIVQIREKNKIRIKSIEDLVDEFETLNYLLSLKRVQVKGIISKLEKAIDFLI